MVWARAPISVRDIPLPNDVLAISAYPLARYRRAFDLFVSAAGYNACCEILQSGLPSLLVPNTMVADDQVERAQLVSTRMPVVVSPCASAGERRDAISRLLSLESDSAGRPQVDLDGAEVAADEIMALVAQRATR